MNNIFRLKIAFQTMKDHLKITIILTFLFMAMAAMYAGMFPSFEKSLIEMMDSEFIESFNFFPHADQMHTYVGFLTLELYNIFWLLLLAIMFGFIASSCVAKEVEGKTIDILMSNPVSRKQIVLEKFVGLIPMIIIINFSMMAVIIGITVALNETLNYTNLLVVHLISIPYFLAVISIGLLLSTIIDDKMRSSIFMISILVGMFILNSVSLMASDYEAIGFFSFLHYFDTFNVLEFGKVDGIGLVVFIGVTLICLIGAMMYFEKRDIEIT
jgi:ABC-2 type transport system permease protein